MCSILSGLGVVLADEHMHQQTSYAYEALNCRQKRGRSNDFIVICKIQRKGKEMELSITMEIQNFVND